MSVRPLRLALVGEYPVEEDALHAGGMQSVTHCLAHAMARRDDVECHVISAAPGVREPYREVGALRVHLIPRLSLPRLATCRLHDAPRLVRKIRSIQPDLVHGQGQDRHGLAAVQSGFPVVITPHGVVHLESRILKRHAFDAWGAVKGFLLNRTGRETFRRADDLIIISRYLPEVCGGLLRAPVHFIENPVDPTFFELVRQPEPGRLLFAGTILPRKRVHELVRAVACLKRMEEAEGPVAEPTQLRVVGPPLDAGSIAQIEQLVAEHLLQDRVTLTGAISQAELFEEYRRAEILVLASQEETAPQIIAQAMACGMPAVAAAVAGIPHMVKDGKTALLYPLGDAEAAARQIRRLRTDPRLRQEMGSRAREEAESRFHPEAIAEQTVEVYRQRLAAR